MKKADLSVLDISSAIIAKVESMPENMEYFYMGKFPYFLRHKSLKFSNILTFLALSRNNFFKMNVLLGMVLALLLSLVPPFCRLLLSSAAEMPLPSLHSNIGNTSLPLSTWQMTHIMEYISQCSCVVMAGAFGSSPR